MCACMYVYMYLRLQEQKGTCHEVGSVEARVIFKAKSWLEPSLVINIVSRVSDDSICIVSRVSDYFRQILAIYAVAACVITHVM